MSKGHCGYISACDQMPWIITQTNRYTCMHACTHMCTWHIHWHTCTNMTQAHTHIYTTHMCTYTPYTRTCFLGIFHVQPFTQIKSFMQMKYKWITQQTAINNFLHGQKAWILHNVRYLWLWNYDEPHFVLPWVTHKQLLLASILMNPVVEVMSCLSKLILHIMNGLTTNWM